MTRHMTLEQTIQESIKEAMKAKDIACLSDGRTISAAVKELLG